jgi:predicted transcriptional regulator
MVGAIRELPANAAVDDAIERLVFLAKIEIGLAQLDRGEGISHDEAKRRLGRCPISRLRSWPQDSPGWS